MLHWPTLIGHVCSVTRMLQKQSFFFRFFLIYFFIFCVQSCLSVAIINFRQTCDCKRGPLTGKADNVNAVSRGSIVFSSSFQWLYVQLFFFVCVCFFSPFKLRKPSLYKYDLYRLLCLTAALLDCIFIMDSVIFQEVLCISLCLQHSTAFHMIVWFITVVIVFSLVVSARALHWFIKYYMVSPRVLSLCVTTHQQWLWWLAARGLGLKTPLFSCF